MTFINLAQSTQQQSQTLFKEHQIGNQTILFSIAQDIPLPFMLLNNSQLTPIAMTVVAILHTEEALIRNIENKKEEVILPSPATYAVQKVIFFALALISMLPKKVFLKTLNEAKTNSFGVTITMSKDETPNPSEPLNVVISLETDSATFDENSTALNPEGVVLEGDDSDFPGLLDLLLDSQCQDHIFRNHSLLHGIHTSDETMTIKGQVANSSTSIDARTFVIFSYATSRRTFPQTIFFPIAVGCTPC